MTDFTGALHSYTYDANGNILTETVGDQVIEYVYDSQNRLVEYYDPIANTTAKYVYDDRGNIVEKYVGGYLSKEEILEYGWEVYGSTTYTYGDSTWADLLTNYKGTSITYDELGNPLNWHGGRNVTLTWENGRQLAQYANATSQYDFEYNADGLRTKKTVTNKKNSTVTKSTEYYIVNGQYIGEVTNIGGTDYVIAYVYDENGAPAGINVNGSAYYFAKNLQGDVTEILDYQGNIVAKYVYDAWGEIVYITDGDGYYISSNTHVAHLNPFRYRGYMYDRETGFYYLRSRYYSPVVGRFINADLLIQSDLKESNLFIYGKSNPIAYGDSCGFDAVLLISTEDGGHIGLLIQDENGDWYHFYWGAKNPSGLLISILLGFPVSVKTYLEKIEQNDDESFNPKSLDDINANVSYEKEYEMMVYLDGDFTNSLNAAKSVKENGKSYFFWGVNCSNVSFLILAASDTKYRDEAIRASTRILPYTAFCEFISPPKKKNILFPLKPIRISPLFM